MIRNTLSFLLAAGAGAIGVAACGTSVHTNNNPIGTGGTAGTDAGGSGATTAATECSGACCPTKNSCYSDPTKGPSSPGSECLATRDNSQTPDRIQMRLMWINPTSPIGLTNPLVYLSLNNFATVPWTDCALKGNSGYVQLVDFDLSAGIARNGFGTFLGAAMGEDQNAKTQAALSKGLCMAVAPDSVGKGTLTNGNVEQLNFGASELYTGKDLITQFPADQKAKYPDYPTGLPQPMPQPWAVGPNRATQLTVDFDLTAPPIAELAPAGTDLSKFPTQREELLSRFDKATGDLGQKGFDGVFFFDKVKGHSHGYSPVGWQILYDTGSPTAYELIPIREAEISSDFNDPAHPNCVGQYNGSTLAGAAACTSGGTPTNPPGGTPSNAWSGPAGVNGKAPGSTQGYFLTVELEQIWSNVLKQTLCVLYPTSAASFAAGWGTADVPLCRHGVNGKTWKGTDPIGGIPVGDWCSIDNKPAHDGCHDAYRNVTYQAYAATNIQDGTCPVDSTTGIATP